MDACLYIRGNEWKNFEEKLRTFPLTNKDARALKRVCRIRKRSSYNRSIRQNRNLEQRKMA